VVAVRQELAYCASYAHLTQDQGVYPAAAAMEPMPEASNYGKDSGGEIEEKFDNRNNVT
jgi:hypothetical protein